MRVISEGGVTGIGADVERRGKSGGCLSKIGTYLCPVGHIWGADLCRGDAARGIEKLFSNIAPSIHVRDVARVMILDAENANGPQGCKVYENSAIHAAAKANLAPSSK